MKDDEIKKMLADTNKLKRFLENPEPGLWTWYEAVEAMVEELIADLHYLKGGK